MADFNLSAEVSMDVDPLKASKTTIERNLKAINKSLRNQRKEFKQNEASAEALSQQENDLGRAIKLQEGLLKQRNSTLNEMQRQMKQSNNVTDEQKIKLQNASRAVQQAENQLNSYENELKQTQTQQKLLGRTTNQVKNSLGQLRNEAKLTDMRFKQSEKSVQGYKSRLAELSHTMQKQKAHTDLLKGNLRELERAQQGNSREAIGLRNDLIKEAIAFQVLQGRIDETTDELREYQRQQRLMGTASNAWVGARNEMDRIATTLRSLGELTQGVVGGVMTTHFSAIVPILGSIVSLGAGLGGMLTAAAGGAIGMGGAFSIAGVAVKAFAGQATYALKMLEDGQLRVTKEVLAYQSALSGLKSSWESLIAQNQAAIFNTMTNGINTAKYALTTLNPFLTKTASQIETASGKMLHWAKTSSVAKRSFDILNTQGPKIFQHLLNATQSFVNGSAALFNKLSPLYGWAAKGFADMAKSFDNWANSVEGSKAINGFIEYTKVNLPIVGSIFGNIFSGIISLFQAFSGHSHNVLLGIQSVTKGFAEWSAGLKKSDGFQQFVQYLETNGPKVWSLIKNITSTLWGLAKGMAPVGAAVLSISAAFFKWTATMTNAHPMIGKILGLLTAFGGVALLAAKPILLFRGALLGATGATTLFGKAGAFAKIQMGLIAAKAKISAAAMAIWTGVTKGAAFANKMLALSFKGIGVAIRSIPVIGWIIAGITALVGAIIYLWKTNEGFRNAVITAWNAIKNTAISVFGFLKPYIVGIWNGIKTASIWVWNTLKTAAVATWNGIKFAVQHPIQALKAVLSAIWNGIKAAAIWIWNALKTSVVNIVKALVNGVKWYINTVKTVISTVFNAAKSIAIRIWTTIKNTVVNLAKGLWTGVKTAFNWLKKGVISIFNAVKNFTIKVWTTIKNAVVSRAKTLWTGVRVAFNGLKKSVISIFNSVKNFAIKVWTTIKNTVISRAKSLWNGVRATFNALKKGVISIFNSVKNFAVKVWTNIRNGVVSRAKSLWNGVRNTFNALRKGVQNIFTSVKNFVFKIWTSIRNNVISKAKSLWNGVRNTWNSLKKGTISLFNSVSSFLNKKWNAIKSSTVSKAKALWSGVKGAWNALSKGTRNVMNSVGSFLKNKWNGIKNSTVNLVTGMKNKITGVMKKMGDSIKSITGKIKGFFSGMIDKVKSGLNKLIEGVNWVGEKLGMDKLPKIKLHTGTEHTNTTTNVVKNGKIARDTFATVGDRGRGNGPGGFRHEAIKYPNGKMALTPNKDTTTFLPQGSTVYNGAQTHAMLSNSNPTFSKGTLPRFSKGTEKKKDWNFAQNALEGANAIRKDATKQVVNGGKAVVNKSLDVAAKGKKWLEKSVGDVMDWIKKPGKLLDKVLESVGLDFSGFGIPKGASLPYDMMKGMFSKLKKAATDTIKNWMEEAEGGDGDAAWLLKHPVLQKFGHYTGGLMFNGGRHYGIDFGMPTGTKIRALTDGTITQAGAVSGGGGNQITLKEPGGKYFQWYMHLSKILAKQGQKVKTGDVLGLSGNTGNSTTPHLHIQRMKGGLGNDKALSNVMSWLKGLGGGGNGKWKSKVKQAAKATGVKLSGSKLNDILKLIQTESGGRAGVTQQIQDVNSGGNEAQGLLQYTPTTFRGYAAKGKKNIKNGYHQLMAFFNNSNWSSDLAAWKRRMARGSTGWGPTGSRRGYATGTNNAPRGLAQVFEKGGEIMNLRGGEQIIPNDVSIAAIKSVIESDIFNRTQSAVYEGISRYADQLRDKQQMATREQMELQRLSQANVDIQEQNSILKDMLHTMQDLLQSSRNNEVYNQTTANKNMTLNGEKIAEDTNYRLGQQSRMKTFNFGGRL